MYSSIRKPLFSLIAVLLFSACQDEFSSREQLLEVPSAVAGNSPASIGIVGSTQDVSTPTSGGTVLMGGGPDVDEAIQWMINKSGGGDFVILRASGGTGYNQYILDLGNANSVETLLIDSRSLANNSQVEQTIREAEALFIAGGDQWDYVNFWKDTKVEDAINYLRNTKRVPIGGTSAGCAIQGEGYYTAENGTIRSRDALRNPYNNNVTLQRNNFLDNPYLENTITDTHYDNPDRRGRHMTFLARANVDWGWNAKGIGVDEDTAVCIDANGKASVFGYGYAFFLKQNGSGPEVCRSGQRLDWYRGRQAVEVYKVRGNASGSRYFWLDTWNSGSGGSWEFFYVDRGRFGTS